MNFIACVWYSPLWWYDLSWDLDDAQNEQKEKKKKHRTKILKQQTTKKQRRKKKNRFLLLDGHSELIPSKFYDRLKYQREPLTKRSKIVAITIIVNTSSRHKRRESIHSTKLAFACVCVSERARVCA